VTVLLLQKLQVMQAAAKHLHLRCASRLLLLPALPVTPAAAGAAAAADAPHCHYLQPKCCRRCLQHLRPSSLLLQVKQISACSSVQSQVL
jgi:hypothetical protein